MRRALLRVVVVPATTCALVAIPAATASAHGAPSGGLASAVAAATPVLGSLSPNSLAAPDSQKRRPELLQVALEPVGAVATATARKAPIRIPAPRAVVVARKTGHHRSRTGSIDRVTVAPGLIPIVPIGPAPRGPRPRVAAAAPRQHLFARPSLLASPRLPAPSEGFWFAVVLGVLLIGRTTLAVGRRRVTASPCL